MLAHEALDPRTPPPMIKFRHFITFLCCEYLFYPPFSFIKMGMKIPIGRGGLCKTSMRH